MVPHGYGIPEQNGDYVAKVYFGWKLLTLKDGKWFHSGGLGAWTAGAPTEWVGPLPEEMDYDL